MMSASSASWRAMARPRSVFRFKVRLFLLRACTDHHSDVPSFSTRHWRIGSPPSGDSTLMTSAPNSASMREQNGPAISVPSSSTLMPAMGPADGVVGLFSINFSSKHDKQGHSVWVLPTRLGSPLLQCRFYHLPDLLQWPM